MHSAVLLLVAGKILEASLYPVVTAYMSVQCGLHLIRQMRETSIDLVCALLSPHCHEKLRLLPLLVGNSQLQKSFCPQPVRRLIVSCNYKETEGKHC